MSLSGVLPGNALLLRNTFASSCCFKVLRFYSNGNFNTHLTIGRCSLRAACSKMMGKRRGQGKEPGFLSHKIFDSNDSNTMKLQMQTSGAYEFRNFQDYYSEQITAEARSVGWPAVVIAFDIETTGLSREERIIEVAFRDLLGGRNSTLQTLVNPEKEVNNSHIHGITSAMVTKPGVPRMKDLIPIVLEYVKSRRVDGKPVVFVAHNGRTFDIPFFIREFHRCQVEFPLDWLFIDTRSLARKLVTKEGKRHSSVSLESLRKYYRIPLLGASHRAMQDVNTLCLVLQKMSFELELSVADLLEDAFSASDILTRGSIQQTLT